MPESVSDTNTKNVNGVHKENYNEVEILFWRAVMSRLHPEHTNLNTTRIIL